MHASIVFALLAAAATTPDAPSQDASSQARPILPGWWSYTTSTILPGASEGRQCVRPDKIDEFLEGPHNRHYHCTYPSKRVGDGQAFFDGECVGKHGDRYKLKIAGTYSTTRFTLKGRIQGTILGLPLSSPISIDARWLAAECPPGAK